MPYLAMRDNTKIYYEEHGRGETVLFVHGLSSSHFELKPFMKNFEGEYHCVCYDHRGHAASERTTKHMNVRTLGQDLREVIEYLDLRDIHVIGHSMGAATIFSYVNQFGCDRLKSITAVDMTPYMRNTVWEGGIGLGKWTDEDFMTDFDMMFDDLGAANWRITKDLMNPALSSTPKEFEPAMISMCRGDFDPFTVVAMWYSLFRTDQREAISKITVPFLYLMPETPLYSMTTVNFYRDNVKGKFVLEDDFPGTTHLLLMEKPNEAAKKVKAFLKSQED